MKYANKQFQISRGLVFGAQFILTGQPVGFVLGLHEIFLMKEIT